MTVPLDGIPLHAQATTIRDLEALGYTDLWSAEVTGTDGLTPHWPWPRCGAPTMRLGTAILPVFTRGPALLAQSAASLATAAPGPVRPGARNLVGRDRRAMERDRFRRALRAGPGHRRVPEGRIRR